MAIRFDPTFQALDNNGDPINGAQLFFYEAGTTTKLDTYSNKDLTVANANPVVADSAGRFGDIWLKAQSYKVRYCAAGEDDPPTSSIDDWDPVDGALTVVGDDFKVSPQDPADMTVSVGVGTLYDMVGKSRISKTAQTSAAMAAPTTNPRYDIIHINRRTGVIGITTGSEAASPSDPTLAAGLLPLARISLATSTTEITDSLITDIRELANIGAGGAAEYDVSAAAGAIAVNEQDWTAIASSSTVNIGAAATERVNITGTTTITAFDTVTAGLAREVRFDGALTLTHNGTSLILPGAANITTASGDVAKFVSEGSGNWRCTKYMKASGLPLGGDLGARVWLYTETVGGTVATVDIESGDLDWTAYDLYEVEVIGMTVDTDDVEISLRVYDTVLAAWQADASDYNYHGQRSASTGTTASYSAAASVILLTGSPSAGDAVGNAAAEAFHCKMTINEPADATKYKKILFSSQWDRTDGSPGFKFGTGSYIGATNPISGIRLLPQSGNFDGGKIVVYGVKTS